MRLIRNAFSLTVPFLAILLLFTATPVQAVSNRIFLSTNGNNAGDCANPLTPCLTFAGALAQVNPAGEIIAEATGGYGALSITQSVTISGPPGVVIYSGLSVSVNAPGAIVVLRGLTIDGAGASANGINVVAVGTLHVENCVITGFAGSDAAHGNGILFGAPAGNLFLNDTIARENGGSGVWVDPTSGGAVASIDHCRFERSKYGVIAAAASFVAIRDSVASGNSTAGILAENSSEINVESCFVASNEDGITSIFGSTIRVSNTAVTGNATGLFANGSTLISRGNNTVQGNTAKGAFTSTITGD